MNLTSWLDEVYTFLGHEVFFKHLRRFKKVRNGYTACCPEHDDKHPSFWMPNGKPWGKCYACNYFTTWWKELEKKGLKGIEIIWEFSRLSGVPVPEEWEVEKIIRAAKSREELEKWWDDRRTALWQPEGSDVLQYLRSRGYSDDLIRKMDVGVHLGRKHTIEGIVLPPPEYRLLIPVRARGGRIIGFAGRRLDDEKPKYMYTKGLNRSELLFGQHLLKRDALPIVVEGILDTESLAAAGIEGIVALGGAHASAKQIQTLAGYKQIILALDADEAGMLGMEKLVRELSVRGVRTYVADLAGKKDPDELLRAAGPDAVETALKCAVPGLDWLAWRLFSVVERQIERDKKLLEAIDFAAKLPPVLSVEFSTELAKSAGTPAESLSEEIARIRSKQAREEAIRQAQSELAKGNVEKAIEALNALNTTDTIETIEPIKFDSEDEIKAMLSAIPQGIELPWSSVGKFVKLMPGLTVIGAATSAGKSTFLYNLILHFLEQKGVIFIWSGEVTRQMILARLLAMLAGRSTSEVLSQIREGAADADIWEGTRQLMALVSEKLYIVDEPLTVDELAIKVRAIMKHHKITAIMVDYLQQLLPPNKNDGKYATREQEVTAIAQALHRLGTELGVPVVAAAQLSRNNFQYRERPKLTDLRESGGIEHYATTVLGLWNATMAAARLAAEATPAAPIEGWYWTPTDGSSPEADSALAMAASLGGTLLEISILKNRWLGHVGKTIPLLFHPVSGRIEDLPSTPGSAGIETTVEERVVTFRKRRK